jgi:DNA invertase Pin-like site-specific DNA recombinase
MDGDVDFVACDMPMASRLTLHILAAVAEHEREMISQRTKTALAAAKSRGVRLGGPNPVGAGAVGVASIKANADRRASNVSPVIESIRASGITTLQGIADALNARGIPTPRWAGAGTRPAWRA